MTHHGDGVYRSVNAGKEWQYLGLPNSRHIAAIQIHPQNPDIVYVVGVQGALYYRARTGVYCSKDGGSVLAAIAFRQ